MEEVAGEELPKPGSEKYEELLRIAAIRQLQKKVFWNRMALATLTIIILVDFFNLYSSPF